MAIIKKIIQNFCKSEFKVLMAVFIAAIFSLFFLSQKINAEEIDPNAVLERRQQLEEELAKLESQIASYQATIEEKQREATTFERDIAILDAGIAKAKLEIKARDLNINKIVAAINDRSQIIDGFLGKIDEEKASLAEFFRRMNELDNTPLIEALLGYEKLSDFFVDSDNFESIQKSIQESLAAIRSIKADTETEIEDLQNKKGEEMELRALQTLEKKRKEEAEENKNNLLKLTKGKEKEYQKLLTSRQKDAAAIRSQLFLLTGSPSIPFEKAVEYANIAFRATGVRPAFLLGVIAEESNLGENIGQCLLTNSPSKGDGKGKNTGTLFRRVMKSTRDVDPFIRITAKLGLDPMQMPISCSQSGGYGGAMGPAQFIPSTWESYESRIAALTGHNPPNPWNPYDAFMAAALYLRNLGAAAGGYTAERTAALKYFAGGNWNKSSWAFYGDDVMALAAKYQEQIDIILR